MEFFHDTVIARFNYWIYVILMMIGLYAMITKNNLIKKLIGMSIFQTAIILFFVSVGAKEGATIPIISHHQHAEVATGAVEVHDEGQNGVEGESESHAGTAEGIDPHGYINPLPHVLMLTAIVVGVATLGVGLAVAQRIYRDFGTLEENEILERIHQTDD
ncbi:MAG: cation:proton antiporter subunit C [Proteobacteria bacterium]|nr:cation:proton antiporter subunit C [Pseudomonadota bacterium]